MLQGICMRYAVVGETVHSSCRYAEVTCKTILIVQRKLSVRDRYM